MIIREVWKEANSRSLHTSLFEMSGIEHIREVLFILLEKSHISNSLSWLLEWKLVLENDYVKKYSWKICSESRRSMWVCCQIKDEHSCEKAYNSTQTLESMARDWRAAKRMSGLLKLHRVVKVDKLHCTNLFRSIGILTILLFHMHLFVKGNMNTVYKYIKSFF